MVKNPRYICVFNIEHSRTAYTWIHNSHARKDVALLLNPSVVNIESKIYFIYVRHKHVIGELKGKVLMSISFFIKCVYTYKCVFPKLNNKNINILCMTITVINFNISKIYQKKKIIVKLGGTFFVFLFFFFFVFLNSVILSHCLNIEWYTQKLDYYKLRLKYYLIHQCTIKDRILHRQKRALKLHNR